MKIDLQINIDQFLQKISEDPFHYINIDSITPLHDKNNNAAVLVSPRELDIGFTYSNLKIYEKYKSDYYEDYEDDDVKLSVAVAMSSAKIKLTRKTTILYQAPNGPIPRYHYHYIISASSLDVCIYAERKSLLITSDLMQLSNYRAIFIHDIETAMPVAMTIVKQEPGTRFDITKLFQMKPYRV